MLNSTAALALAASLQASQTPIDTTIRQAAVLVDASYWRGACSTQISPRMVEHLTIIRNRLSEGRPDGLSFTVAKMMRDATAKGLTHQDRYTEQQCTRILQRSWADVRNAPYVLIMEQSQ